MKKKGFLKHNYIQTNLNNNLRAIGNKINKRIKTEKENENNNDEEDKVEDISNYGSRKNELFKLEEQKREVVEFISELKFM